VVVVNCCLGLYGVVAGVVGLGVVVVVVLVVVVSASMAAFVVLLDGVAAAGIVLVVFSATFCTSSLEVLKLWNLFFGKLKFW